VRKRHPGEAALASISFRTGGACRPAVVVVAALVGGFYLAPAIDDSGEE
jgi:hypothetical protein